MVIDHREKVAYGLKYESLMETIYSIPFFKMLLFGVTVSLIAAFSKSYAQSVGFEKEYATVGYMNKEWGERQIDTSRSLLQLIQRKFNGFGQIESTLWKKYPEKKVYHLFYRDPNGGIWSIDPESVNTGGLDGLELVTPPLISDEDLQRAKEILHEIKKEKLVMRGLRSSGHVTVDVLHLLQDNENISDLVDLILTIENNWSEIYKYFNPKRYGTIINRFSVPLAVDQQRLLKELAEMPRGLRTYNNVRNIFLKYDSVENNLRNEDGQNAGRKWKYRAANYAKLFRLNQNTPLSVIEFRIPDLDFGSKLIEHAQFVRQLVNLENKDKTFKAPFGWKKLTWKEASEVIKRIPENSAFAERFNIESGNAAAPKESSIELVDISQPIEKNSEYFTYGFEAEFQGANTVSTDKFPFLDYDVGLEDTGNTEVRSIGGEIHMDEVLEQMSKIKAALKNDLRGFHFRVRIPKTVADNVGSKDLEAFANSIGDYVFAWRLQNRRSFFSLKSKTVGRNSLKNIDRRGTVRLIKLDDGKYDLEIRGFMTDIQMIGKTAQIFVTGLMNPGQINTTYKEREVRSKKILSLSDFVSLYFSVSPEEKDILKRLESSITGEGILPLYRFEDTIDLDKYERVRIRHANFEFAKETKSVVRNVLLNKYNGNFEEAGKQFRWRVKRWAQLLDLTYILERHLLGESTPKSLKRRESFEQRNLERSGLRLFRRIEKLLNDQDPQIRSRGAIALQGQTGHKTLNFIEKALQDPDIFVRTKAVIALKNQTGDKALALIELALQDQGSEVRSEAADGLQYKTGDKVLVLIEKALHDINASVRNNGAIALKNQTGDKALALIEKALQDTDASVRGKAASALQYQTGDKVLVLIEKALQDTEPSVRNNAAYALQTQTDEKTLGLIEKALQDTNANVKNNATIALRFHKGDKALTLIETVLSDVDARVRDSAVTALHFQSGDKALFLIEKVLNGYDARARKNAAIALKYQSGDKALALIEKALHDPDAGVRNNAANAIQYQTVDKGFALIEKALQFQDPDIRESAAYALRNQTGDKALVLIEKALQDENVSVRSNAVQAIRNQTGSKTLALVEIALQDPIAKVRTLAVSVRNSILISAKRDVLDTHGSLNPKFQVNLIKRCERIF